MQKACMWRHRHTGEFWAVQITDMSSADYTMPLSTVKSKSSACLQSHKILKNWVRHLRPLAKVAMISDVAFISGWNRHIYFCTPWHVRTHTKQVPKLCRWQSRVFILREEKKSQLNLPLNIDPNSPKFWKEVRRISTHFIILVKQLLEELVT